jgi:sulfur carrier protein
MEITVNGEAKTLSPGVTVADLMEEMGLIGKRLAVEINLEIVPRSSHETHQLQVGDRVEIVHAIGGG